MTDGLASESAAELLGWSPRLSGHLLADGTPLKVYVQFSPEGAAISDLGATLSSITGELSPELRSALLAICRNNDLQLDGGAILAHVPPGGEVGEAVDRLGRVCAQISRTASADASLPR
jgi:hypothetical protein